MWARLAVALQEDDLSRSTGLHGESTGSAASAASARGGLWARWALAFKEEDLSRRAGLSAWWFAGIGGCSAVALQVGGGFPPGGAWMDALRGVTRLGGSAVALQWGGGLPTGAAADALRGVTTF